MAHVDAGAMRAFTSGRRDTEGARASGKRGCTTGDEGARPATGAAIDFDQLSRDILEHVDSLLRGKHRRSPAAVIRSSWDWELGRLRGGEETEKLGLGLKLEWRRRTLLGVLQGRRMFEKTGQSHISIKRGGKRAVSHLAVVLRRGAQPALPEHR